MCVSESPVAFFSLPALALLIREQVGRNICHGSDSVENAEKEIDLWFGDSEVVDHESAMKDWIYE